MKERVFLVLMIMAVTHVFAQNNVIDTKGRKQGEWVKYHPNSKIIDFKGTFKDGVPQGLFVYYFPNGKKKAEMQHENNGAKTSANLYYDNGKLMSYGIYRYQKKDSIWTSFNEFGRLVMRETYNNDLLNGEKRMYYIPSDPEMKREVCISITNYKDGKIEGPFAEYYPSGQLKATGQYLNFKREGEWVYYELDGKKMSVERYYKGEKHGWFIGYNQDGKEGQKRYIYYGRELSGKELEINMKSQKEKGLNPNKGYR